MLGTHGHLAVRVLSQSTPTVNRASVINCLLRGPVTLTSVAERLAVELHVTTCFYDLHLSRLGFEHPTFRLRGQRSNPLRHRRSDNNSKCYEWLNGIENCMYLTFWISLIFIELILIRYFVVDSAMETCN